MEAELGGIMSTEEAAQAVGVPVAVLMQAARLGRVPFTRRRSGRSGFWDTGRLQFLLRDVQEWFTIYDPQCHGITQKRLLGDLCKHCGKGSIYARRLCKACYNYEKRTGEMRPLPKTAEEIAAELAALPPRPINCHDPVHIDDDGIEWVTQAKAAEILGICRERVRQLVSVGKLKGQKFGNARAVRLKRGDVEARIRK